MWSAFAGIFGVALIGALTVPIIMLVLARFGYFEPIEFELFGRQWQFAPKITLLTAHTNAATWIWPRPALASGSIPAVLAIVVPLQLGQVRETTRSLSESANITTQTDASASVKLVINAD